MSDINLANVERKENEYYSKFIDKANEFMKGAVHSTTFKQYCAGAIVMAKNRQLRLQREMFELHKNRLKAIQPLPSPKVKIDKK